MMTSKGDEKMKKHRRIEREHAVSPVVGVMLMLVVTIIIAAVVSAFAGGLTTGKEKAPQVSLETHIQLHGGMMGGTQMTIKHLGGDPINTRNVKLVTSWVNASSGTYHVQSTVAPTYNTTNAAFDVSSLNTDSWGVQYNEPYLVVPGVVPGGDNTLWFGNYIMRAGDVIKADMNMDTSNTLTDKQIIKDVNSLTGNEIVNVKLIDLISGSAIYDKDVIVEV
jgi:FlaG/FlaF family flagellin (archaellin)